MSALTKKEAEAKVKQNLKKRLKATADRYESVFNKPLTVEELQFYLAEEKKRCRLDFLRDRMGVIGDTEIAYLESIISEYGKVKELPVELGEELEELTEDEVEDIDFDE